MMDNLRVEALWIPPAGTVIVSMIPYHDYVVIATQDGLYRMSADFEVRPVPLPPANENIEIEWGTRYQRQSYL